MAAAEGVGLGAAGTAPPGIVVAKTCGEFSRGAQAGAPQGLGGHISFSADAGQRLCELWCAAASRDIFGALKNGDVWRDASTHEVFMHLYNSSSTCIPETGVGSMSKYKDSLASR